MRDRAEDLRRRNAQVLVVMPQEPAHVKFAVKGFDVKYVGALREVLDRKGQFVFPVLGDPACTVSATYGIAFQGMHGLFNRPATFVIDRDGVIRYEAKRGDVSDQPSAEQILKVIDGLGD